MGPGTPPRKQPAISRMKNYVTGAFWHAIGSDQRFTPRWYERAAYIEGLRDANRIIEQERDKQYRTSTSVTQRTFIVEHLRNAQRRIYARGATVAPTICTMTDITAK